MIQIVVALLLGALFVPLRVRLGATSFSAIVKGYVVFNAFLLLWGCLENLVFHAVAFDRFYVSVDRVIDCIPFIPFGQWVLDQSLGQSHGRLLGGATLWQLRVLWLMVTVPVWLLTYFSTSYICKQRLIRRGVVHA
ncbi:hypothetical protein ACXR0O_15845 [Verrucomicrobiota bacterium sgz303538]